MATKTLSPNMLDALRLAAERSDGSVSADKRTRDALVRRGLVDIHRGRGTGYVYQGPFRRSREYTTYNVITGVYINDAGRTALGSAGAPRKREASTDEKIDTCEPDEGAPKPRSSKATYRTVKVGRRGTHKRYRAVVRYPDGHTVTIGKSEYRTKVEATAFAQRHIDYMRGLTE